MQQILTRDKSTTNNSHMQILTSKNSNCMRKRQKNAVVALTIFAALALNSACNNSGWALVGEIFGWSLIIGGMFLVVDNKLKKMED